MQEDFNIEWELCTKYAIMVTGEIKNKIDQIWDTFFVAGITNPITVLEQMTYIFFMKMLDDKQLQEEANARDWDSEVQNPTFWVFQALRAERRPELLHSTKVRLGKVLRFLGCESKHTREGMVYRLNAIAA